MSAVNVTHVAQSNALSGDVPRWSGHRILSWAKKTDLRNASQHVCARRGMSGLVMDCPALPGLAARAWEIMKRRDRAGACCQKREADHQQGGEGSFAPAAAEIAPVELHRFRDCADGRCRALQHS